MKQVNIILSCALLLFLSYRTAAQELPRESARHHKGRPDPTRTGSTLTNIDTIFSMGRPYAILSHKRTPEALTYTLTSMDGTELIVIPIVCLRKNEECRYIFNFKTVNGKAEVPEDSHRLDELIVERGLVKNNELDPESVKRMIKRYPSYDNVNTVLAPDENKKRPENSSSKGLEISGSEVRQGSKLICTFKSEQREERGRSIRVITFNAPSGNKAAEATGGRDGEYVLLTMKDNSTRNFQAEEESEVIRELVQFLLRGGYL